MIFTILIVALSSALFQTPASTADGFEWDGVVPLRSTRVDVERIFGKPTEPDCFDCKYVTPSVKLFVDYSVAPCKGGLKHGWNVPTDTVISYTVYPQNDIRMTAEQMKVEEPLYYKIDSFVFQERGIAYTLEQLINKIQQISYMPKELDNSQRCEGFPAYNPWGSIITPDNVFSRDRAFGDLDLEVARSMNNSAQSVSYVVVYADKHMSERDYDSLLKSYDLHLYTKRGASRDKIKLVRGGWRDAFAGNIFYSTNDAPPPVPSPDYPGALPKRN